MDHRDRELWEQLSPLIDEVLELEADARPAYLAALDGRHPELAARLVRLLAAHERAAADGFLAQGPSMAATPAADALAGFTVGAYTLERPLGMGGMGTVWLGRRSDGQFTGTVAVKLVNLAMLDAGAIERFSREASILARLTHPNIARLYDAGVTPMGQPYLVLEYVEGQRVDHYADAARLDVRARLGLFLQVAEAVAHAHANLVVHRDLKPSNILVGTDGRVKLLDFGIARLLGDDTPGAAAITTATRSGALTPEYAAPEQLSAGVVTTATDVYALGVVLFQLLSGQHPTAAEARTAVDFLRALDQPATRLTVALRRAATRRDGAAIASARGTTMARLQRLCRDDLDTILTVALRREPAARYAGAAAFADDIRRYLRRLPVSAQPDSLWYRVRRLVARRRVEAVAAALVGFAVLGGAGVAVWQARVADRERDFALDQLRRSQASNDLNEFLLADAAPGGRAFTAGDVLARAQRIAEQEHATTPDAHVGTLVMLGRQYAALELEDRAFDVLERAYALARALPPSPARGVVACEFANVLDSRSDPRTQAMLDEGMRETAGDLRFVSERVACELRASQIGRRGAQPAEGLAHAQAAKALLDGSALGSPLTHLHVATNLASSYAFAGQDAAADGAFRDAFTQLTALGRQQTKAAGTLLNNWALSVHGAGRPLDAEPLYQRALAIESADDSGRGVSATLLTNLGRAHFDLRHLPDAVQTVERALEVADRNGDVVGAEQARILLATVLRETGDLTRAAALVAEHERYVSRSMPPGHPARSYLALVRANLAMSRGEMAAAGVDFDAAVAMNERGGLPRRAALARALTARSTYALADHRAGAAAADASRAVAIFGELLGADRHSSQQGRAYLALGRARLAQGDDEATQLALRTAATQLTTAVGAEHPDTRAALVALAALDRR